MIVAGAVARSAAKAGRITPLRVGQKIHLFVDRSRACRVKSLFAVYYRLALGVAAQKILCHKGIRLVRALIVDRALPAVKPVLSDRVSGASPCTLAATVARVKEGTSREASSRRRARRVSWKAGKGYLVANAQVGTR